MNFRHILVVLASTLCLSLPAQAQSKEIPEWYQNIDLLDYSSVSILGTILGDMDVARAVGEVGEQGGRLCRVAYVSHDFDKVTFELRFVKVGSFGGPPPAPWRGSFRVHMQAPADGSLQVVGLTPAKIENRNPPAGWYR